MSTFLTSEDVLEDDDEEDEGKGLSLREKEDLRLQKEKEPPPGNSPLLRLIIHRCPFHVYTFNHHHNNLRYHNDYHDHHQ